MSGHSKWSTIKRQKGAEDKKRGLVFSKLSRAITVAARGGSDPEANVKLRLAIEEAKAANMPKDTIKRAIERGSGRGGAEVFEEVSYEGYGPSGAAVLVEVLTDNKNRTVSAIKKIFERGGGNLATPGSVAYQFEKTGLITIKKPKESDQAILSIIDLGVEDVEEAIDAIEVYTKPADLEKFREKLKTSGFEVLETKIYMRPKTIVAIKEKKEAQKILRLMENLESHDDVQRVFANFDIKKELIS
jgi:YebC/PmpR family DNA-binding regulatory protein